MLAKHLRLNTSFKKWNETTIGSYTVAVVVSKSPLVITKLVLRQGYCKKFIRVVGNKIGYINWTELLLLDFMFAALDSRGGSRRVLVYIFH